jgi:hypothetical protein
MKVTKLTDKSFYKDGYVFKVPKRTSKKKYDVYKDGIFLTSFGSNTNNQYRDKIGYYKNLDHLDKDKRKRFYDRFGKSPKFESALWFSQRFLW